MPKRADETREKTKLAKQRIETERAEEKHRKADALEKLRSVEVTKWAEHAVAKLLTEIDNAATFGAVNRVELKLPKCEFDYYELLWRLYGDILGQDAIESMLPTVHALIVTMLKEKHGYNVDGPFKREDHDRHGNDGMGNTIRWKAILVSW